MFEDHGSTRIDLTCPYCRQLFKVRLRKLQFGADLTCRLCRHEFSAQEVSSRPEVQDALARMHRIVEQQTKQMGHYQPSPVTVLAPAGKRKLAKHQGDEPRPITAQQSGEQGSSEV